MASGQTIDRTECAAAAATRSAPTSCGDAQLDSAAAGRGRTISFLQTQAEGAGAQEVSRQIARGAIVKGWRARQIFLYRRTDAFDSEPGAVFCAPERPRSPAGVARMLLRLYAELRREAPVALVTFQHYGNVVAAPVARLAGVKLVVANQVSAPQTISRAVRLADKIAGCLGAYDHVVVNSAATQAAYASYPAPYERRLIRIDHGFREKSSQLGKAGARRALGLPPEAALVGFAGRLHPLKQIDLAIRTLSFGGDHQLVIAGQGPDRARLEALAREIGVLARVRFLGELGAQAMGDFLAALDVFVFPSAAETFGLAPVEAAQAGLPVVANDLAILRDVLRTQDGPCALFADALDTPAFAVAIRRVFDDAALAQALGARGRRLAERFPLQAMVDAYLNLADPAAA